MVAAGEASGDDLAAEVVRRLRVSGFGLGGPRLAAVGTELVSQLSAVTSMGPVGPLLRAPAILRVGIDLLAEARRRRPRAALLVGFSEFNGWLGRRLRRLGIRVVWYAPPQIWAWGTGRGQRFAGACDVMAVLLPFERELWRSFGKEAHFVGHPAAVEPFEAPTHARQSLGLARDGRTLALLPGSRPAEVKRHLADMLLAARILRERDAVEPRIFTASSLDIATQTWLRRRAAQAGIPCLGPGSDRVLSAFDVALVKSGTGSLKCALAGATPIIVYRTGRLVDAAARRLLKVPNIGLPNIVLGEARFTELFGPSVSAEAMLRSVRQVLTGSRDGVECISRLIARLLPAPDGPGAPTPADRVAALIEPWLD